LRKGGGRVANAEKRSGRGERRRDAGAHGAETGWVEREFRSKRLRRRVRIRISKKKPHQALQGWEQSNPEKSGSAEVMVARRVKRREGGVRQKKDGQVEEKNKKREVSKNKGRRGGGEALSTTTGMRRRPIR